MQIGFSHVAIDGPRASSALVLLALRAARKALPDVPIVHLTDETTERLPVADAVIRRPRLPIALGCLDHFVAAGAGDWLFLDTDALVQHGFPVREVFRGATWDLAVATRDGTLTEKEVGTKFMARMPFNKGAVFSRTPAFWQDAYDWLAQQSPKLQQWMGDQRAMNVVIAAAKYRTLVLDKAFNYPPRRADEDLSERVIVHYKGDRKKWLQAVAA